MKMMGPGFLLQLDTIFQHIALPQICYKIWFSMLSWALVSRVSSHFVSGKHVTYVKIYRYVGLLRHSSP